jgi:hypothetical protein
MTAQSKRQRPLPPQFVANAGKGRKPGVPNKVTRQVREAVALIVEQSVDQIRHWLYEVGRTDPENGLEMAIRLAQVATGKVRAEAEGFAAKYAHAHAGALGKCGEMSGVSADIARVGAREGPVVSHAIARTREGTMVSRVIARACEEPQVAPAAQPICIPIGDDELADPYNPRN